MPETFGKRARKDVKARKAAAAEERRVARAQRRKDREAGLSTVCPPSRRVPCFAGFVPS